MNSNTNDMVEVKRCPKCGEEKPLDEFSNDKNRLDGKQFWCKKCIKEYQRAYVQQHPELKEYKSNYRKEWRAKNPKYHIDYYHQRKNRNEN